MKLFLVVLLTVVPSVIAVRRTGNVILVDSFTWDFQVPRFKIGSKSAITVGVTAGIARQSDSISGKNLWRLGIFGSKYTNGSGERINFREQILTPKQASKQPRRGNPLKFKNVQSRFDLSRIGCGELRYFCVELNKNPDSTVDFELRWGTELDGIVRCRELDCRRPGVNIMADESSTCGRPCPSLEVAGGPVCGSDGQQYNSLCELDKAARCEGVQVELDHEGECVPELPSTCVQTCPSPEEAGGPVCGSNGQQYSSLCELDKAARCEGVSVELDHEGECVPGPELLVTAFLWSARTRANVDHDPSLTLLSIDLLLSTINWDVKMKGTNFWQVSLFGSKNNRGKGARYANVEQALDHSLSSTPLKRGLLLMPIFLVPFNMSAIGCGDVSYFCLEIKRNPESSASFTLENLFSGSTSIIKCREVSCISPREWKYLVFTRIKTELSKDVLRIGAPSDLSLKVSIEVCQRSEGIIGGKNLWQVGIYGSRNKDGSGEKLNFIHQLLNESDSLHSPDILPGMVFDFPIMSFQFDISAIGCEEYPYLCIVVAKGPNPTPDFSIHSVARNTVVTCFTMQCIDQ